MNIIQYPDWATISRSGYPDIQAGRTDDLLAGKCPNCGESHDIAVLASDKEDDKSKLRECVCWCPCGCVFAVDKGKITLVYNFYEIRREIAQNSVIVITRTSKYELSVEGDGYKLKKISLDPYETSVVPVGKEFHFRKLDVYLWNSYKDQYNLIFGDMHTSPVQNPDEVRIWLQQNK